MAGPKNAFVKSGQHPNASAYAFFTHFFDGAQIGMPINLTNATAVGNTSSAEIKGETKVEKNEANEKKFTVYEILINAIKSLFYLFLFICLIIHLALLRL